MIATAIIGFDVSVLARWHRRNLPWNEDATFIVVCLVCLDMIPFAYLWVVARAIRTPQNAQTPWIVSMGCLLAAMLFIAAPILWILS